MKTRLFCAFILVGLIAAGAYSTPISYISATTVPTSFVPYGGDFSKGIFSVSGVRPLIVHYSDGSQVPFQNGTIEMVTSLKTLTSVDGRASGVFESGTISLKDSSGADLLSGSVTEVKLSEVFDNLGVFAANGTFTPTSGSLLGDFGANGLVYQIVFQVQPTSVDDLTIPLSGFSNVSLAPVVPEPITLGLLSLGLAGLAAYRRKRA